MPPLKKTRPPVMWEGGWHSEFLIPNSEFRILRSSYSRIVNGMVVGSLVPGEALVPSITAP